jgi:signal transduction histidine kinase
LVLTKYSLKILILEDNDDDATIIQRLLRKSDAGYEFSVVMSKPGYLSALTEFQPHVILSDNALPQFDATEALQIVKQLELHIPFILVTGTVSEEFAANIIKSGADDYLLKDRLTRLPVAIAAALNQKKIEKEKWQADKDLKDLNQQLQSLSSHLQNVREEERTQIAKEIHDELGQQLSGLKMEIALLVKKLDTKDEALQRKGNDIICLIDQAVISVQKILSNLRPGILDDLGLIAALEWHSSEVEKLSGIHIIFKANTKGLILPETTSTGLFRIYQEALANIISYSNANKVESRLTIKNNNLILELKDDRQIVHPEMKSNNKTLALIGVQQRIFLLGGQCEMKSETGGGNTFKVAIPL